MTLRVELERFLALRLPMVPYCVTCSAAVKGLEGCGQAGFVELGLDFPVDAMLHFSPDERSNSSFPSHVLRVKPKCGRMDFFDSCDACFRPIKFMI